MLPWVWEVLSGIILMGLDGRSLVYTRCVVKGCIVNGWQWK